MFHVWSSVKHDLRAPFLSN